MPLITSYASASKRGFTGHEYQSPSLVYTVNLNYEAVGAPVNGMRLYAEAVDSIITIDWGDGTTDTLLAGQSQIFTHIWPATSTYTVSIGGRGYVRSFDPARLDKLLSWGSEFYWTSCVSAFSGAVNLVDETDGYPQFANALSCYQMFSGCTQFNPDLSQWNTIQVTDMTAMFQNSGLRNWSFKNWDVSNVTSMASMFSGCQNFGADGDGGTWNWNTINVTNMQFMFSSAGNNIWTATINFDTSNVTNMLAMFRYSGYTNSDTTGGICNWDTSSVTNMSRMFENTLNFNASIGNWVTSSVTDMSRMFGYDGTTLGVKHPFNKPIGTWDTSNVTNMGFMFQKSNFNQPIGTWNTSSLTNMEQMFMDNTNFNQSINSWDVGSLQIMRFAFRGCTAFNQPLNSWNTASLTDVRTCFAGATAFNQPLGAWQVSGISRTNMQQMFAGCTSYNQDLSTWCVTQITTAPSDFDIGCTSWTLPRPVWGTCP